MHPSKIILLSALFFALAGCTNPSKGKDDSSGASFLIKSLGGSGTASVIPGSVWQIPETVSFTFNACVTSRGTTKSLKGQDFQIETPGSRVVIPVESSPTLGCFIWHEDIPYDHFAGQSGWVEIERDIVGRGVNVGKQSVVISINPWAAAGRDPGPSVLYADGNQTFTPPKSFAKSFGVRALSGEMQGSARLLVQDVSIKAIPEGEDETWTALMVEVNMTPVVQSLDATGKFNYQPIQDGDFDIMMQVLGSNVGADMNQKVILLGGDLHTVGKAVNGKLKAEFKVRQERRSSQGNLELVIQVRPRALSAYRTLMPFNGLFRFGPGSVVDSQKGTLANLCLESAESCDYNTILSQTANYNDLMKKGYIQENSRYIFSTLKLRFTSILPGETATQRIVVYTASTCITDNQTGRPLANSMMQIRYQRANNGEVDMEPEYVNKRTDETGCLSWNGQAFHKYYAPEHFYEKIITIQKAKEELDAKGNVVVDESSCRPIKVNGKAKYDAQGQPVIDPATCKDTYVAASNFSRQLRFYLNPWDDKFTFGWDSREFTDDFFQEVQSRAKIPSRFFVSQYQYHTVRFLYNIDNFMDLEVKKWVLMDVTPMVLRYSGIVNARKMVEHARDGIYLMKVAIQKDYLDPRDNSGWLLSRNDDYQAQMANVNGHELATKEYITTNMSLVRVVDGVIVYPIDLTMRDLRLMRVRSNFLIELETVDERLIQAYHVFKPAAVNAVDLEKKLERYKQTLEDGKTLEDVRKELGADAPPSELAQIMKVRTSVGSSGDVQAAREDLEAQVKQIQEMVQMSVAKLGMNFANGGQIGTTKSGSMSVVPAGTLINDNFDIRPDLLGPLKTAMNFDFSLVELPKKEDIDLNTFVEKGSGLEARTFVGPVIFLSNAYSDSMRSTDNLDEANCQPREAKTGEDGLPIRLADKGDVTVHKVIDELVLDYLADNEIYKREQEFFQNRTNNAYQYNKYFNSLNKLCYASVDGLMEEAKTLDANREDAAVAASLKSNFVANFNLDFVSLTDEGLNDVRPDCPLGKASECLVPTQKDVVPVSDIAPLINKGLGLAIETQNGSMSVDSLKNIYHGIAYKAQKNSWDPSEYYKLFYERTPDSKAGLCNLLANKTAQDLHTKGLTSVPEAQLAAKFNDLCWGNNGLVQDIKLHVERTGNYLFMGGLNLNLNVGESFSVSNSSGWSSGMELTDFVGGKVIKPFGLKYGTSMSSSDGTGVAESTYLVSQIARFEIDIPQYERCVAVRLSDSAIETFGETWGTGPSFWRVIDFSMSDSKVLDVLKRGYFVCEGKTKVPNPAVKRYESYFYFTQHFTEGDMLDQADLYNCPWLLAMRGMRDFSTFVNTIRAQQLVDLPAFLQSATGLAEPRRKAWAIEHMLDAYRNVLPSFPGYYTELRADEMDIDAFALEQAESKFTKVDNDGLKEVIHPALSDANRATLTAPPTPVP